MVGMNVGAVKFLLNVTVRIETTRYNKSHRK